MRDALLGATPATALRDWRYMAIPFVCAFIVFVAHPALVRASEVIVVIDAVSRDRDPAAKQRTLKESLWKP